MQLQIGYHYLLTTLDWFYGPDGRKYKAVFGLVKGIYKAEDYLPAKPARGSENWFINIGNMTIAGCQVRYAILVDTVDAGRVKESHYHDGKYYDSERDSDIFDTTQYEIRSTLKSVDDTIKSIDNIIDIL